MEERRRFAQTSTIIHIKLTNPTFGTLIGSTRDISDGGALVMVDNELVPPVGTVVDVVFKKVVGPVNAQPVAMKVMHTHKNTLGLMFLAR